MPKNTKGGKKHKQLKNNSSKHGINNILLKDNSGYQYYAIVEKYYGHNADVKFIKQISKLTRKNITSDNNIDIQNIEDLLHTCKAIIRGSIAKKCMLKAGDVVLVSIRDYDDKKVDLLYKYSDEEYKYMYHNKFIDETFSNLVNNIINSSSKLNDKCIKDNITVNDILLDTNDDEIIFDEYSNDDITEDEDDLENI